MYLGTGLISAQVIIYTLGLPKTVRVRCISARPFAYGRDPTALGWADDWQQNRFWPTLRRS